MRVCAVASRSISFVQQIDFSSVLTSADVAAQEKQAPKTNKTKTIFKKIIFNLREIAKPMREKEKQ